jgi:hypothetical protein
MKNVRRIFKEIIKTECITQQEREYFKEQLNQFLEQRQFLSRKPIETDSMEEEDEEMYDWVQNNFG